MVNGKINYSFSIFEDCQSFFGPVFMLDSPLAAETKKKKPTTPEMPKIAARGSNEKENIKIINQNK